jgi:hypothetical protein
LGFKHPGHLFGKFNFVSHKKHYGIHFFCRREKMAIISGFHGITNDLTTFPTHQVPGFLALFIVMIIHHALMGTDFTLPVFSYSIHTTRLIWLHAFLSIE